MYVTQIFIVIVVPGGILTGSVGLLAGYRRL